MEIGQSQQIIAICKFISDFLLSVSWRFYMFNLPPLNTETIWAIIHETIDDATVNQLIWYYLGYRYNPELQIWETTELLSEWRDEYPQPPDFFDSRPAAMKLTRSIPPENKQLLKQKLGFKGYKIGEFGPRQTRRATMANWLLSYMEIHGIQYQTVDSH